jgi:predicted transposase YbfD/YdcC
VVEVFRAGRLLDLPDWQTHAVEAVRVTRTVQHQDVATGWKWRCTHEIAWYASSGKGNSAADYAAATRGHWGIENRLHYVLDVSMHEDASRVRKNPTILSILRSFALNILRFNKVNNVADTLWRNAMNFNRVLAGSVATFGVGRKASARRDQLPSQAASWNSSAMNAAWALMSLPPMFRTCPFLIIAIAS